MTRRRTATCKALYPGSIPGVASRYCCLQLVGCRGAAIRADTDAVAAQLRRVIAAYPRDQLGPAAAALALDLIGRVARGEVKVRHAQDASELIRTLVDVARLEAGEPTSAALVATVNASDVAARVAELQRSARAAPVVAAGELADVKPSPPASVTGDDQAEA